MITLLFLKNNNLKEKSVCNIYFYKDKNIEFYISYFAFNEEISHVDIICNLEFEKNIQKFINDIEKISKYK